MSEGWKPADIGAHLVPAMKSNFVDLGPTTSVFGWEPV
jgi:hypothetical protein